MRNMPKGSKRVEKLSHFKGGEIEDVFRIKEKIEDVKKKIQARTRKVHYSGIGVFVCTSGSER